MTRVMSPSRRPWLRSQSRTRCCADRNAASNAGPLATAGAPSGASASRTLRAASLLLVLFISRRTSPTGVASSLSAWAWRGRGAAASRSTTMPRRLPPVSAKRSATMRGAGIGGAVVAPGAGCSSTGAGGLT